MAHEGVNGERESAREDDDKESLLPGKKMERTLMGCVRR